MQVKLTGRQEPIQLKFHYNRELFSATALVFQGSEFKNAATVKCNPENKNCFGTTKNSLRKEAIRQAIEVLPKKVRTRIWNTYRTQTKPYRWAKN